MGLMLFFACNMCSS